MTASTLTRDTASDDDDCNVRQNEEPRTDEQNEHLRAKVEHMRLWRSNQAGAEQDAVDRQRGRRRG